jgi:hypothetical protein
MLDFDVENIVKFLFLLTKQKKTFIQSLPFKTIAAGVSCVNTNSTLK